MDKQLEPLLGEDLLHLKEYQIGERLHAYPWIDHWQNAQTFSAYTYSSRLPQKTCCKME